MFSWLTDLVFSKQYNLPYRLNVFDIKPAFTNFDFLNKTKVI